MMTPFASFPRTRSAVLERPGAPLQIMDLRVPPPGSHEVLVKVAYAGVCGSDESVLQGHRVHPLPVVAGHEGSAIIEAVGSDVTGIRLGQHVIINWQPSCGECYFCLKGSSNLCPSFPEKTTPETARFFTEGGKPVFSYSNVGCFSEFLILHESCCVPIPDDLPLPVAALIGCAVATGIGAVENDAKVRAGDSVVVLGAGGVGLNVLIAASLARADPIVVVDRAEAKRSLTLSLGAGHFLQPGDGLVDEIRSLTGGRGADFVFDAVGRPELQAMAVSAIRAGGMAVFVGLPPTGSEVRLPARGIPGNALQIRGSLYGGVSPREYIPTLVERYRLGRLPIDRLVSRTYPLGQINEAFTALRSGETARGLIEFS